MATTITVKNIPAAIYKNLTMSADRHHRSINSEIITLLEEKFTARKRSPEEVLAAVRALREKTRGLYLTQEDIDRAIKEGRH